MTDTWLNFVKDARKAGIVSDDNDKTEETPKGISNAYTYIKLLCKAQASNNHLRLQKLFTTKLSQLDHSIQFTTKIVSGVMHA